MVKNKSFIVDQKKFFCPFCSFKLKTIFIENRNRLFCSKCQIPIYENPLPAACVILINNVNKVLLVKRKVDPQKGKWCLPGGFIEIGETAEQAAKRELEEETGLKGQVDKLVGVFSSSEIASHSVIIIGYLVKLFYGNLKPGDDASEAKFFDRSSIPKLAFKSHTRFISKLNFLESRKIVELMP